MMDRKRALELLDLTSAEDRKAVKKAYARMAARYHPEEYPEEWKRIHEAYQLLSSQAVAQGQNIRNISGVYGEENAEPETGVRVKERIKEGSGTAFLPHESVSLKELQEDRSSEMEGLFHQIHELSRSRQEEEQQYLQKKTLQAVVELEQLFRKKRPFSSGRLEEWQEFLERQGIEVLLQEELLIALRKQLKKVCISPRLHRLLQDWRRILYDSGMTGGKLSSASWQEIVRQTFSEAEQARKQYYKTLILPRKNKEKEPLWISRNWAVIQIALLILIWCVFCSLLNKLEPWEKLEELEDRNEAIQQQQYEQIKEY